MKKEFKKFNLENLNDKQIDFYNFVINNLDDILELTVREISEKYGCGISFIYNFLANIKTNGWKTFIFKLGVMRGIDSAVEIDQSFTMEENFKNKITNLIFNNIKSSDFKNRIILDEQYNKIDNLCNDIIKADRILGFGQGHGLLAVNDLFGMFSKFELKCVQLIKNKNNFKQIMNEVNKNDILIIYSFKGVSEFTIDFYKAIKKSQPDLKIYLITSNYKNKISDDEGKIIYIHNNLMDIQIDGEIILASPLKSFIIFNDYLKTFLYYKNKESFSNLKLLKNELNSWKDNNNDYYKTDNKNIEKD